MLTTEQIKSLRELDSSKVEAFLMSELRGSLERVSYSAYAVAYVLVRSAETGDADLSTLDSFTETCGIADDIAHFLAETLNEKWDIIARAKGVFSPEMYKAFLLFHDNSDFRYGAFATPVSIDKLAVALLDAKENHIIANYFSGTGSFIRECYAVQPYAFYNGLDFDIEKNEIAKMRAEIIGDNITVETCDIVSMGFDRKYDRIFANYPFGSKVRSDDNSTALQFINNIFEDTYKQIPLEWAANITIINTLKEGGKAAAVTTAGMFFRGGAEKELRKYFIDNGYIEAIIAMPSEMFEYTRVQTLMLVLSFENKGVRFIDASGICVKGRRYNTFSDTNIEEIIRLCSADSKNSKFVSNEDISANDYILEPKMYLEIKREIINGVPLGELLRSVTRGSQITAAQLDKIASEKPTNYCYLRLADLQNGQVATELPYLVSIEKKLEKYSIKDKCMIVSKIGNPIKTAVITVPEEMAVLVTGNMYVLELDESKVDPYYVQAYFESKIGASYLNSLSVGVAIQNLPLESLTKMQIPVPAMEVQKRIAEEYLAAVEEIRKYKNKIIEVENRIRKGFENV